MKIKDTEFSFVFKMFAYVIITLMSLFCIVPLLLIISGSLTADSSLIRDGYSIIPRQFSLDGYRFVFRFPQTILQAYGVTIFTTVIGTVVGMFFMTMAGFVLQRKDFKYRNKLSFYIYFTTLFGGGLIPWYIMITKYLKLTDSYLALIYPGLMTPFLIILMRSFISSAIPDEIIESAKIDGANDFKIYYSIVLKLALPGIATVGLFLSLQYWNDWFSSAMFINTPAKYQLQFYLYNLMNTMQAMRDLAIGTGISFEGEMPNESGRMAMAIIVTGPIVFLYPFVQRYFVKGLTIGAVKG